MSNRLVVRAKNYRKFSGILSGLTISIAVILVAFITQEIIKNPFFVYALAAFIYSALALLNTFSWYGRVIEISEMGDENNYSPYWEFGTLFYYSGYWAIFLGLLFFTYSIETGNTINFPFLISVIFLICTFFESGHEIYYEIFQKRGDNLVWIIGIIILIFFIVISVLPFMMKV